MLKFSDNSGAMICDEEAINSERRRIHQDENIRNLMSPEISEKFGIEVFYGGAGYPAFHYEVFRKARKAMDLWAKEKTSATVEDVARITLDCFREVIRRKVDDKLHFYFGFDLDELNQGFYKKGEEKVEIEQECIKKKAREISDSSGKAPHIRHIFNNQGVVMGFDPDNGFQAYQIKGDVTVLSFLRGFETVGKGRYAAAISFARTFNRKFLSERRDGFDRGEGMILLLLSAIEAKSYFIDIGGYFSITYIDGNGRTHAERFREVEPHRVKLAEEVVYAHLKGLLDRDKTRELVEKIIFEDIPPDELENEFFESVEEPVLLEYVLRGYKIEMENLRREEVELKNPPEDESPPVTGDDESNSEKGDDE